MKAFLTTKTFWLAVLGLIAGAGYVWFSSQAAGLPVGVETGVVQHTDVIEVISETGYVEAAQAVDMAFERGGRVAQLSVQAGTSVSEGDVLLALDDSVATADLAAADARLQAEQVRLQELLHGADANSLAVAQSAVTAAQTTLDNAQRNLQEVTDQQNQQVESAQETLRSSGLQAYLVSKERENSDYSYAAPTISGTYTGTAEGKYEAELYASAAPSGYSYRVSGLGSNTGSVSTVNPQPLGDDGLFIQFPNNFAKSTQWEIPVPNTRSAVYSTNLNTYQSATEGRSVAIANAESAVAAARAGLQQAQSQLTQSASSARGERVAAQRALVRQMQAAVDSAQVQYDNLTLTAPFSGIVTDTHTQVGEIVSATAPAISLISPDQYELTVAISEVDIAEVSVDDKAQVQFDAYEGDIFHAHVASIAPNAELVDGVRVFNITLHFDETSEKIRAGLSADIDITTAVKERVLAIPTRSIYEDEKGKFVRVISPEQAINIVRVKTGLRGTNGLTEIVSGLTGGENIITFADDGALAQLEK